MDENRTASTEFTTVNQYLLLLPSETEDEERGEKAGSERKTRMAVVEEGDRGEYGQREEVAKDTEGELVDAHIERDLGDDMVSAIYDLYQHHRRVCSSPRLLRSSRSHLLLKLLLFSGFQFNRQVRLEYSKSKKAKEKYLLKF